MNVTLNKTDLINAVITVVIEKVDYENKVENSLKDLRKNANIPGFRKGMVPTSFLRQKYRKSILLEEINNLLLKALGDYLKENSLTFLGEPLPSEEQTPNDFDEQEDFIFNFDIGLSPSIDVQLTKDDRMPYFLIQVTDEMIDNQIESFRTQYSEYSSAEDVEADDMIKGRLTELDENGEAKENGITAESAIAIPAYIMNEEEKAKFLNTKLHSIIIFNPYKAYDGNVSELASFLHIKKDDVPNYTGDFSYEINEINRYKNAEINQDLFDKIYGQGTVDSEAAFREKIKENIAQLFVPNSDFKFTLDVRKLINEKTADIQFPETFLKRWLLASNTKWTPESFEAYFPKILNNLKYQLVKEKLIEENGITIEEGELQEYAKQTVLSQLAQYGVNDLAEKALEKYAREMLQKKENYKSLGDNLFENRLMKILKEQVTLEPQEITIEEYNKMIS